MTLWSRIRAAVRRPLLAARATKNVATETLLAARVVLLGTPIDERVAEEVIAKLLYLENEDPAAPVTLFIDSPGGAVTPCIAIHDTLRKLRAPVSTHCIGRANGVAALLLAAGTRGLRFAAPHATVLLTPVEMRPGSVERLDKAFDTVFGRLSAATGLSRGTLERFVVEGRPLDGAEAKAAGFFDDVVVLRANAAAR